VPGRAEIIDVYDCLDPYPAQHQLALLAASDAFRAAIAADGRGAHGSLAEWRYSRP
jgi:hypothetical protein